MRWERIRARGLGPFKREVDITLPTGGELVALVGPNGAGKSTALELLCAALYRAAPTRGTLADLATARDAFVEAHVVNGQRFTVRQQVDAISGKGETVALDAHGAPLLESTKVRDWDRWASEHLERPEVLYAGQVAVQGRRGFLDLSRADRVKVLNRALGIERLERMAAAASDRAKAARADLDAARARLAEVPQFEMDHLHAALDRAQHDATRAGEAVKAARLALQRGQAAAADVTRAMELAEQRRAAQVRLTAAETKVADLESRIGKNRELLARGGEVRAAVARAAELREDARTAEAARAAAESEARRCVEAVRVAERALAEQRKAAADARARVEACERRLADRERVLAAAGEAQRLRAALETEEAAVQSHTAEVERLTQLTLAGKDRRIDGLRTGLEQCIESGNHMTTARVALRADDGFAADLAAAPSILLDERERLAAATRSVTTLRAKLRAAELLAARGAEMESAAADLEESLDLRVDAETTLLERSAECDAAHVAKVAAENAWAAARDAVPALQAHLDALAPTVALVQHLDQAEGRIEAYEAELPSARAAADAARSELAGLPEGDAPESIDLGQLQRQVDAQERVERDATAASVRAAQDLEAAEKAHARRAELAVEVRAAESEVADWTRLAQDLGRDGLQALEIDAAIPEINEICNALLHECHGPRFTVELRTDRLTADGKRTVEDLEVRVIDTVEGRDAEASTYSGGELVIVGEAIALALTTLACRRAGVERPSLIRDESGAALSPENARAYVAMLRMAARQIGAAHVLFVSHVPELQELADVRIEISADHQVTVGGVA